jgi:hypothetical protein
MSDRGILAAKSNSKEKWRTLHMYTREGRDRDLQQINARFQVIANYINSYNMKETDPNALQYSGVYCSNSVADEFEIFSTNIPDQRKTISELNKCFETCFLLSKSSDNL